MIDKLILETGDLKRAGRAVLIASVIYILVTDCAPPFHEIRAFGVEVRMNSDTLKKVLLAVLLYHSAIFALRVAYSGIFYRRMECRSAADEKLDEWRDLIHKQFEADLVPHREKLDSARVRTNEETENDLNMAEVEFEKSRRALIGRREARYRQAEWTSNIRATIDFLQPIASDVIVPLTFFSAAMFFNAGSLVCEAPPKIDPQPADQAVKESHTPAERQ